MRAQRKNKPVKAPAKAKPARAKKAPSTRKISTERRLRPIVRRAVFVLIVLLLSSVVGGIYWTWKQGYIDQAWHGVETTTARLVDRFSSATGLVLKHVVIEGHHVVTKEQVLAAMGLDSSKQYSLLRLSGDELRDHIEAIEFIKNVEVQKQFPNTILLRITEREPIALWQNAGQIKLLDSEGIVLDVPKRGSFSKLPVMVGEDAAFHAKALFDFLISEPRLFEKVRAMSLIHGRRWDVLLKEGVVVKLPELHPEQAWSTLARLNEQHHLLEKPIKSIDLRIPDKLYILPAAEGVVEKKPEAPAAEKPSKPEPDEHD